MTTARYANDAGAVLLSSEGRPDLYIEERTNPDLYNRVISEEFGPVAPYVPPVEPDLEPTIPQSVTRRQGRLALLFAEKLDAVEAVIAAIEDPVERRAAEIEYEAGTWERSNAFLQAMWAQLGGTEAELDALFVLAANK